MNRDMENQPNKSLQDDALNQRVFEFLESWKSEIDAVLGDDSNYKTAELLEYLKLKNRKDFAAQENELIDETEESFDFFELNNNQVIDDVTVDKAMKGNEESVESFDDYYLEAYSELEDEPEYKTEGLYEYIEGLMRYNEVKYDRYIDKTYIKEITKFLKFYTVAYIKVYNADKINLKNTAKEIFDFDELGADSKEIVRSLGVGEWLEVDPAFNKFYKDLCKFYSKITINAEIKRRAGIEDSPKKNLKGKYILKNNISELEALNRMMQRQPGMLEADKAHRKIRTDNVNMLTNKNLQELNDYLNEEINLSNIEFKNISYYKLEMKLGYELQKCIWKNIHVLNENREKIEYILLAIEYIYTMPVLSIRENLLNKLLSAFDKADTTKVEQWKSDVTIIKEIVQQSLGQVFGSLKKEASRFKDISQEELKEFLQIYSCGENGKKEFSNNYKIKKDYSQLDVELFMNVVHEINKFQINKIVEDIKSDNEKETL